MDDGLEIIGAAFGLMNVTRAVTNLVNRSASPQTLSVLASDSVFTDGWPGYTKTLVVIYRYGSTGIVDVAIQMENQSLKILGPPSTGRAVTSSSLPTLRIFGAAYGNWDVTERVAGLVNPKSQTLNFTPSDVIFDGMTTSFKKTFVIVAAYDDALPFVDIIPQDTPYSLTYRPPFNLISAAWGQADVTFAVQTMVRRRQLTVTPNLGVFTDNWPGVSKTLVVVSQYGNQVPRISIVKENDTLSIDYIPDGSVLQIDPDPAHLNVLAASWGPAPCTSKVVDLIQDQTLDFGISTSSLGPDPWPENVNKSFTLTYSWGTSPPDLLIVTQGWVGVELPTPTMPKDLLSLGGVVSSGDVIVIASKVNMRYWQADPKTGRITATAGSIDDATRFIISLPSADTDEVTLSCTVGDSRAVPVAIGTGGILYAFASAQPVTFALSVTAAGSLMLNALSAVGPRTTYVACNPDDFTIIAQGSGMPNLCSTFELMLQPTEVGTQNHLARNNIRRDATSQLSPVVLATAKVMADLFPGLVRVLDIFPPSFGASTSTDVLVYQIVKSDQYVNTLLDAIVAGAKDYEEPWAAVVLSMEFMGVLWKRNLLPRVVRIILIDFAWYSIGYIAAGIVQMCATPFGVKIPLMVIEGLQWCIKFYIDVNTLISHMDDK